MATPIDEFVAGVKGLPFTPGKHGFPEGISVGRRHAASTAYVHGAQASTSFWWNLGSETDMSVYNIAGNSIGYANAENIRLQSVNPAAAEGMGISPQKLTEISKNPNNRGSIAFSKLDAKKTSLYHGGGEEIGQAIQTTDKVSKYTLMDLPDSVIHDSTGPKIIVGGKKRALTKEILKEDPQFHDWMKSFAQNIKDTVGDGARLPTGTQELLDAPTMSEGNAAFKRYLESVGKANDFPEARLTSIMPDAEGLLNFEYSGADGNLLTAQTRRASIDAHIGQKSLLPEARISSLAKVASESTKEEAMVAEAVTQAGGMAKRTLSGVLEAGEVAAKVMRYRL